MAFTIFTANTKAKAAEVNANFDFISRERLIGLDTSGTAAKSEFDIGDLTEITGGSLVGDILTRDSGALETYNSSGVLQNSTNISDLGKYNSNGSDIASSSTLNLDNATGDTVDVTGTTTITAITLSEGILRTVRFTGALTLTNSASLVLPSAANITTEAGDVAIFKGYSGGVVRCINYEKINGQALVSSAIGQILSVQTFTSSGTWNKPAGVNAVIVELVGGGGGGGGNGEGGGGGGYSKKFITSGLGATETVTIGAGGTTTSSGGTGGAGGSTSFGSHCSATGGSGGTATVGGAGGVGSGGDINQAGGSGLNGTTASTEGGAGGASILGAGAGVGNSNSALPNSGGGGGGRGSATNSGAGGSGIVIVYEYS